MKRMRILIFLMLVISLFADDLVTVHATAGERDVAEKTDEFCKQTKCKAVSVAVVDGDETELYGDAEGLYQIGSMTKAFTGLAVQKLISDGLLSEDDKVSGSLPGFTAYYQNEPCDITIRQLLTQTSGYTNNETVYPGAAEEMTLTEWVDSISGKELSSKPGMEYAYSNVNYNILGAVIERASGQSYEEYMEKEILVPLGLTNTYVRVPDDADGIIRGSRLGYRHSFTYEIPVAPGRIPAGYFYSNASDMALWIRIWIGMADIPEQYKMLVGEVKANLNDCGDYYSGWELFENGTTGHSGGTPNYSSRIVFSDKEQTGVCVLTNMNVAASTDSLCNGIYAACIGEESGDINTDVWTVFDIIFTVLTAIGMIVMIPAFFAKKRKVLAVTGGLLTVLLVSVCVIMPLVFGARLRDIMFIWAPYSFTGGLLVLAAGIAVIAIKLVRMRKT